MPESEPLASTRLPATGRRAGVLAFLHGYGQTLEHWSFLRDVLDLPWLELVLLGGPLPASGNGRAWFRLSTEFDEIPGTREDIIRSARRVERFLSGPDSSPEDTVVAGFSQGGTVALELGLRSTLPWRGILAMSCHVHAEPEAGRIGPLARSRRILCTHGTDDRLTPPERARGGCAALSGAGIPIELELFRKAHGFDVFEERRRIRSWLSALFGME